MRWIAPERNSRIIKRGSPGVKTGIDLAQIRKTLEQWIDLSGPVVSDALIEQFILQVIVVDDNTFNWTLDLSDGTDLWLTPSQLAQKRYYEALRGEEDTSLDPHLKAPKELLTLTITAEDAAAYCKAIGLKFFPKKWQDKTVIISI